MGEKKGGGAVSTGKGEKGMVQAVCFGGRSPPHWGEAPSNIDIVMPAMPAMPVSLFTITIITIITITITITISSSSSNSKGVKRCSDIDS